MQDRSKERLGQQLEDLLDDLREELSETEQKLGDKMVLIDKDRDGVITTEEVALACSLLKDRYIPRTTLTPIIAHAPNSSPHTPHTRHDRTHATR